MKIFLDPQYSGGVIKTGYVSACRPNQTDLLKVTSNSRNQTAEVLIHKYPADFVTAYWILAVVSFLLAATFAFYHIHGRITNIRIDKQRDLTANGKKPQLLESLSPKTCSPAHPTYAGIIVALCFIYYGISLPLMRAFTKFVFSYARDGPCLSVDEATGLESAYFAAVTAGRVSAVLISSTIHMKYILQVIDKFVANQFLLFNGYWLQNVFHVDSLPVLEPLRAIISIEIIKFSACILLLLATKRDQYFVRICRLY